MLNENIKPNMHTRKNPGDWVIDAFVRGGVDISKLQLLEPAAFDQALYHPDAITAVEVNLLLIACARLSENNDFGLTMVDLVDPARMGTYYYLLENASTVDEFCSLAERYYPTFYQGGTIEYHSCDKFLRLRFCVDDSESVCSRHDNEWTLGFFAYFLKKRLANKCMLEMTSFNNSKPKSIQKQQALFGKTIRFDHQYSELVYPSSIKKSILNNADPTLLLILRKHAETLLAKFCKENSFSDNVRLLINDKLKDSNVKATDIATTLSLSLSSMKRKLANENTSFRKLKQEVIFELASDLLINSNGSISKIAARLGYSEPSAFCRAFQRHNSISPIKFRRTSREY